MVALVVVATVVYSVKDPGAGSLDLLDKFRGCGERADRHALVFVVGAVCAHLPIAVALRHGGAQSLTYERRRKGLSLFDLVEWKFVDSVEKYVVGVRGFEPPASTCRT